MVRLGLQSGFYCIKPFKILNPHRDQYTIPHADPGDHKDSETNHMGLEPDLETAKLGHVEPG